MDVDADAKTVLVADDESDLREALAALLELEGYQVVGAADGSEALAQLERHHPDLLLIDYMMPKLDGMQVIRLARQSDAWRELPIILTSALPPPANVLPDIGRAGYCAFLRKPFSLEALVEQMDRLLRMRGAHGAT